VKNIKIIRKEIKGSLENNKSLKDFNTWKVGGNAEFFYEPKV
jgi:UDP-N-acetylenolpyruvoylglucosamine reductase